MDVGVIAVIMVFAIPLAAIIGSLAIEALKVVRGGGSGAGKPPSAEDTKMIQQMHHLLSRMEERVEALETLLLERNRKDAQT